MLIFTLLQIFLAFLVPLSSSTYNAGEVEEGTYIEHTFTLLNATKDTIYITALRRTCGCTQVEMTKNKQVLPPGDSCEVFVKISTKGYSGKIEKFVLLYYREDSTKTDFMRLTVVAYVKKFLEEPSTVFFSTQHIIIDVRNKKDFRKCHILGSEHIDKKNLIKIIRNRGLGIPANVNLYIVAKDKADGLQIVKAIKKTGHSRTFLIKGGLKGWESNLGKSLLLCNN